MHHVIAGIIQKYEWLTSIIGIKEIVGKDGTKIDIEINVEEGEIE